MGYETCQTTDSEACELLEIQIYIVICFTVFHCCFHPRKWSMLHADWLSFGCGWLRHQLYHIVGYYVLICTCIPCFLRFLANISCLSLSWVGLKTWASLPLQSHCCCVVDFHCPIPTGGRLLHASRRWDAWFDRGHRGPSNGELPLQQNLFMEAKMDDYLSMIVIYCKIALYIYIYICIFITYN